MTPIDVQLSVSGMHCHSCGLLIDEVVEELDGVTRSATDTRRNTTAVTFDPTRVSVDDITAAIAEVGYVATRVDNDT